MRESKSNMKRIKGAPSLIVEHIAPLKMRTFQQDTALHFVTERSTPDYVAGGEKTRTALASLLLQCKQVYEKTQGDVGETSVAGFTEEAYSQVGPSIAGLLSHQLINRRHRFPQCSSSVTSFSIPINAN
jgi:hypothetical protein